jgi:recombinational DNA repair ATPase RecF
MDNYDEWLDIDKIDEHLLLIDEKIAELRQLRQDLLFIQSNLQFETFLTTMKDDSLTAEQMDMFSKIIKRSKKILTHNKE